MATDILLLDGLPLHRKLKVARAARDLRQSDVAYLGTEELRRRGYDFTKVTAQHVSDLESGLRIERRRHDAILAVLGLDDDQEIGDA